jgi:hypothetical protein
MMLERRNSVPKNMHSMLPERRIEAVDSCGNLSGFCMIKADRHATKQMHVNFKASKDSLRIRFSQTRDGSIEYFQLCDLSLKGLVVGWLWDDSKPFVIAAEFNGELHHAIYCYPTDKARNLWLFFFKTKGVRIVPFSVFQKKEKIHCIDSLKEHSSDEGSKWS